MAKSRYEKNLYFKDRRRRLSEAGLCTTCGKNLAPPGKRKCLTCVDKRRAQHRIDLRKGHYRDLRDEVFAHYGGYMCACCAEDEPSVLTIDHIHNNGGEHRKALGGRRFSGQKFYIWLRRNGFPAGYQVLCWNCNIGKYRNGGICPHLPTVAKHSTCASARTATGSSSQASAETLPFWPE